MAEETDGLFVFNGVDAARGGYLLRPMASADVLALARGEQPDREAREEAVTLREAAQLKDFGTREGVDPRDLGAAGWGVIFAHDEDPAVREALAPLLELRKAQAGRLYREFAGPNGHRPGERKPKFLLRQGAAASGPADPERMPYYLLIVGDPEKIPFEFQAQLDLAYAVGRLHFDTLAEYDHYARSVVAAERGEVALPRRVGLFGPRNPDDQATALSAEGLLGGLERHVRKRMSDWSLDVRVGDRGKKSELAAMLGGPDTPAVLFTASHGAGFPHADPRQRAHQGALICQEWGGPVNWPGPVPQDMYFAGDDLGEAARLAGLVSFHFACYGGGTPKFDAFFHRTGAAAQPIAPHAFLARLPQRMLGHPRGGALAAVAHVERAWGCSFYSGRVGHQIAVFESFMDRLLDGHPIGSALDFFGAKYGELSSDLAVLLEELEYGNKTVAPTEVANMWTANNDARNYLVLGDPAVRVRVADPNAPAPRERLEVAMTPPAAEPASSTMSSPAPPVPAAAPAAPVSPATSPASPSPVSPTMSVASPAPSQPVPPDSPPTPTFAAPVSPDSSREPLAAALQRLVDQISRRLAPAPGPLEISTWTSADLTTVGHDAAGRPTGAVLRATTRIDEDGRTAQILAEGRELDPVLLRAHADAVAAARERAAAAVRSDVEALAALLAALRHLP